MAKILTSKKDPQTRIADMFQSLMETQKKFEKFQNDIKTGKIKFANPKEKAIQQKKKEK